MAQDTARSVQARPIQAIRAVVFDFDGVLVDSEPCWREADRRVVGSVGCELLPIAKKEVIGLKADDAIARLLEIHGIRGDPARYKALRREIMEQFYREVIPLSRGARETLAELHLAGYRMAIASSTARRLVEGALRRHEILEAFEQVVSAEDVAKGKPEPDVFLRAFELLGVEAAEALVVEDSLVGITAARSSGALPVWMENSHAPEARAYASHVITALPELPPLLARLRKIAR